MKLNLGCGSTYMEGFVNIDSREEAKPDLLLEIGRYPFHFDDNTVDEIHAYNSMEHFPNFIEVVHEMARVSKDGALWVIKVPYVTSTLHNLANPYHVNPRFTENTFRFWGDIYQREQPTWFKLEILETKFEYNESVWGHKNDNEFEEMRHKYLNVVTSMTQRIKVIKT